MRAIALILLATAPAAGAPVWADPPPPGALSCTGCHGDVGGASAMPLDGMPAEEIAEALRAFASGEREATVMDRIARGFTPDEMQAIGTWFAEQRGRQ